MSKTQVIAGMLIAKVFDSLQISRQDGVEVLQELIYVAENFMSDRKRDENVVLSPEPKLPC